jgi:DNA-binding protein Fis
MIRQATEEDVLKMFWEDELRRFADELKAGRVDFSEAQCERYAKTVPARRRRFLCETTEDAYRKLLEAAKAGPEMNEARTALAQMVEENVRWARNNLAAHGKDCPEAPLFTRLDELAVQYREALRQLTEPPPATTLATVAAKVDALHSTAEAIHGDTRELKVAVPAVIGEQAKAIRDRDADVAQLSAALSKRIVDLMFVYKRIDPADMEVFLAFMRDGNQVKAAASLGMKEQTLRARVERWLGRGPAYARLYSLYQWRKHTNQSPKEVPFYEAAKYDEEPAQDVEVHILTDIAEVVRDITAKNWEAKRDELLAKYLKEYV